MATREKLRRIVDDLPEQEVDAALEYFVSRGKQADVEQTRIVLEDDDAQRFLQALENPSSHAKRGLARLFSKPSILRGA